MSEGVDVVEAVRHEWPLGPYLKSARESAGLSMQETARRAGVSHAKVRDLERGYKIKDGKQYPVGTTKSTVECVADAVGADVAEALRLVGITKDDPSRPGRRPKGLDLSAVPYEELLAELGRRLSKLPRQP
ncbi:hypothetical protein GCM10022243_64020 [Saccharothrix violaceirubra]|uniref:DNA-binding XRE family transcriptional regulator n=1 Tax=Saccharothrix violaceirubra TaxID=413306 RepID=A0A7W7T9M7_9PSEU|nr:helix-turn-helix transcriptional regulator [Saccharothrix violaceirubra]MBB4969113.1 DNA-binding XRE family transcriptional regulator [Saccharothrix violaceirubra]